jgi:hypothetical protein
MALTLHTNVGFVTTAPTGDPAGANTTIDGSSVVVKDTSPAGATKITEIGWYRGAGTNTANFEVALYSESAGVAATRLFVDATNSSSAGGWIITTVDWAISASTAYWLGLQMDAHSGSSSVDTATSGGSGADVMTSQTTLANPYGGGALADADGMYAIYAVYTSSIYERSPTTVSATATVNAPTTSYAQVVARSTNTVNVTTLVNTPAKSYVQVNATSPSSVALTVTVNQPTAVGTQSYTRTPDTVTMTSVPNVPTTNYIYVVISSPDVVMLTSTVNLPATSVIEAYTRGPSAVGLSISQDAPTRSYIQVESASPSTLALSLSVNQPTVDHSEGAVTPNVVGLSIAANSPTTSYIYVVGTSPETVGLTITVNNATGSQASTSRLIITYKGRVQYKLSDKVILPLT